MRRASRSWLCVMAALVAAGCSDRGAPGTDTTPPKPDSRGDTTPKRDAKADTIDCSLVGCAAPPPCGQPCKEPCGCCPDPACFVDARPGDARPGDAPRKEAGPDLAAKTPCGPSLSCASATEICVESGPVGPGSTFACKPVPAGCAANRTCACAGSTLCTGAFNTCNDVNTPNTIYCECPLCQ